MVQRKYKRKKKNRISISEKEVICIQKDVVEKIKRFHENQKRDKREKKANRMKRIKYILGTIFSLTVIVVEIVLVFV